MQKLLAAFRHRIFWIILILGAVTAYLFGYYLEEYRKVHIHETRLLILLAFFVTAVSTALLFVVTSPGRMTYLSERWISGSGNHADMQYRMLLNSISDIVFELNQDGMVTFINERFRAMTKIPLDDVINHDFFHLFPEGQRDKNRQRFDKFIKGELKPYRVKTHIEMFDGTPRMIEVAFRILNHEEGGLATVIGTMTDKQTVAAAKKAIMAAEQKYKEMFDHAVNGIYHSTPDGKFVNVNPAMARILGYENADDLVRSVHSIATQIYVRPEERAIFKNRIDHQKEIKGYETQMYRKDGSKIWVVENGRAVFDEKGYLRYYEGSIWDVTERIKGQQELEEAKLMAEMTSRTKTDFLANMSHELRTPLNSIIGFSEVLKDEIMGPLGAPDYKEYAADIHKSGNNLLRIISEILEVSKIEAGKRQLNEGPVKVSRAVGACLVILKNKVEENNLKVEMQIPEKLPELIGEELVIKQILLNLVTNAVKFTPSGGQIMIRAYMEYEGARMMLEVTDTGIGMDAEELEKCIQPFWQANSDLARDTSGTGLGLTLVQSLVKMHEAEFEIESEKGKGTTARIIFPENRVLKSAARKEDALKEFDETPEPAVTTGDEMSENAPKS